jgi:hypothetical protein
MEVPFSPLCGSDRLSLKGRKGSEVKLRSAPRAISLFKANSRHPLMSVVIPVGIHLRALYDTVGRTVCLPDWPFGMAGHVA